MSYCPNIYVRTPTETAPVLPMSDTAEHNDALSLRTGQDLKWGGKCPRCGADGTEGIAVEKNSVGICLEEESSKDAQPVEGDLVRCRSCGYHILAGFHLGALVRHLRRRHPLDQPTDPEEVR